MDRNIGLLPKERRLELLCEKPLSALLLKGPFRLLVARRDYLQQLALCPAPLGQVRRDELGLRECERALAGRQDKFLSHSRAPPVRPTSEGLV